MTRLHLLIPAQQLQHARCHSFRIGEQQPIEGFLINWYGKIYAYRNSCPHTGATLNWSPNQFMDIDDRFIQCGLHGALFEPVSGLCIYGPCLGQSLTSLPVRVINAQVYVDLPNLGCK